MTRPIETGTLIEALEWRYATKAFDAGRKIPAATWAALEQALVLSASSFGLQPYRFIVVTDPAIRQQLLSHSWGQRQVVDASHYVVFTSKTVVSREDVQQFIARVAGVRKVAPESLKTYHDMMTGALVEGPLRQVITHWTARQAYIALGNLLTSAALLGIDACPMEGFAPAEYNRVLALNGSGYQSIVCCALGYRSDSDRHARLPKVRAEAAELIRHV